MERTFAIVKPDEFSAGNAGKIISRIYQEEFKIVGLKKLFLSKIEAEGFYYVHKDRPFFDELTDFIKRPQIGATGLIYLRHGADGSLKSSVDKFYNENELKKLIIKEIELDELNKKTDMNDNIKNSIKSPELHYSDKAAEHNSKPG